ncbi:MAG: hypothetical protein QXX55_00445 [Candidatus Pacearchaeota archaeon]
MHTISLRQKHAAMEMSVGTMVTIVLLMIVLVLGIFFIQKIFSAGTNAIETIDNQVQNEIQKLFAQEDKKIVVYPTSRDLTIKKGDDPKGFAFSIKNKGEPSDFSYEITASDVSNCRGALTREEANRYLIGGSGTFSVARDSSLELPILVKFDVSDEAPACTIIYYIKINKGNEFYTGTDVFITIK